MVTMDRWSQVTMFVQPKYKYAESMRRNAPWKWLDQAAPVPSRAENEGSGMNPP